MEPQPLALRHRDPPPTQRHCRSQAPAHPRPRIRPPTSPQRCPRATPRLWLICVSNSPHLSTLWNGGQEVGLGGQTKGFQTENLPRMGRGCALGAQL